MLTAFTSFRSLEVEAGQRKMHHMSLCFPTLLMDGCPSCFAVPSVVVPPSSPAPYILPGAERYRAAWLQLLTSAPATMNFTFKEDWTREGEDLLQPEDLRLPGFNLMEYGSIKCCNNDPQRPSRVLRGGRSRVQLQI